MRRATALVLLLAAAAAVGFRCPGPDPQAPPPPAAGAGGEGGQGGAGGACMDTLCGDACVRLDDDVDHCGACDRACASDNTDQVRCTGGLCDSTCMSGFVNVTLPEGPSNDDDGCELPGRRVFLTAEALLADFGNASLGDARCQEIADGLGMGGTWMAWLSDRSTSPGQRFTQSTVPYLLLGGQIVADGWADLVDGSPLGHAIDQDELGGVDLSFEVWTGTSYGGGLAMADCLGWTSLEMMDVATVGLSSHTDLRWTEIFLQECIRNNVHLYCFEQ